MKLIKKMNGYKLYQKEVNGKFLVEVPSDQNYILKVYPDEFQYIPLTYFLANGVQAVVFHMLKKSGTKSNVELLLNRTHIMSSEHSVVYEHTVHYKGMIQLTIEDDLRSDLIPLSIIADRDGFFMSIQSGAIDTADEMLYTIRDICSSVIFHYDTPRITIHTHEPSSTFYYAACCLTAVVMFGKYIKILN